MYINSKQITLFLSINVVIIILSLVFTIPMVQMTINNFKRFIIETGVILIAIAGIQTLMNMAFYKYIFSNNLRNMKKVTLRLVIGSLSVIIFINRNLRPHFLF